MITDFTIWVNSYKLVLLFDIPHSASTTMRSMSTKHQRSTYLVPGLRTSVIVGSIDAGKIRIPNLEEEPQEALNEEAFERKQARSVKIEGAQIE